MASSKNSWVQTSKASVWQEGTYQYQGSGYDNKRPRRIIYEIGRKKGNKYTRGYQVWETQTVYRGKPSWRTLEGDTTKKSKIFDTKKEAEIYVKKTPPLRITNKTRGD